MVRKSGKGKYSMPTEKKETLSYTFNHALGSGTKPVAVSVIVEDTTATGIIDDVTYDGTSILGKRVRSNH